MDIALLAPSDDRFWGGPMDLLPPNKPEDGIGRYVGVAGRETGDANELDVELAVDNRD